MATSDSTVRSSHFEYKQLYWGDFVVGTKAELQALGIAIGLLFPGEPSGPRRSLRTQESRGFPVTIEPWSYEGTYCARIEFPGRSIPWQEWKPFAPGVKFNDDHGRDEFMGTAEALCAAGLASIQNFPGQPGMRKVTVTIYPDGTVAVGCPTANDKKARQPGVTIIMKRSKSTFLIARLVSKEEKERRWIAREERKQSLIRQFEALPRPAPLYACSKVVPLAVCRANAPNRGDGPAHHQVSPVTRLTACSVVSLERARAQLRPSA